MKAKKEKRIAKFQVAHLKDGGFVSDGQRSFFEYRDLGIAEATGGRFHAIVARALAPCGEGTGRHYHDLDFQLIYILKGWLKAEYEGIGIVKLEAGSCLHNPPGNPHTVFEYSDDLEFLEVTTPAVYDTVEA